MTTDNEQHWDFRQSLDVLNERYARQASEEILLPDLPIIDPHHHLSDRPHQRYLLDEFLADIETGHNILATIYIEGSAMWRPDGEAAWRPLGETEFANGVAAMSASGHYGKVRVNAGIVAYADLRLGERVQPLLEAHLSRAGERLRGIRNRTQYEPRIGVHGTLVPTRDLLRDEQFRAGLKTLARMGLVYDSWQYHPQIPEIAELARAVPEATIVLDHMGGILGIGPFAESRQEELATFRRDIAELATCHNVHVKLGGMGMPHSGLGLSNREIPPGSAELAAAWAPWIETCIEAFGAERCMFESNFPPDKQSCSYPVLWNAFKRIAGGCSDAERAELFFGTANRVYGLEQRVF